MQNILNNLNPEQRLAVVSQGTPLRIIAGAGSGKTRTLTAKIAYLIKEKNIYPNQILAMTFTRKAAHEMLERVNELTNYEFDNLKIFTFHKWCVIFLRRELQNFGFSKNFEIIDDSQSRKLISRILKDMNKSSELYKVESVNFFKSLYLSEQYLGVPINAKLANKYKLYLPIIEAYQSQKRLNDALDYDDLLYTTYSVLKNDATIRENWALHYKAILIDEFQDTDDIQYEIVKLISKHSDVTIVGDPDQTIYTWRGAKLKIILNFDKDFPNTKTITLNKNYRSTGNILKHANSLIKYNYARLEKDLVATKSEGKNLVTKDFDDATSEAIYVAEQILQLRQTGKNWNDMAILYRTHRSSKTLEDVFNRNKIPYRLLSGIGFYNRAEIKEAILLLKTLVLDTDLIWNETINLPQRGIGQVSLDYLNQMATDSKLSIEFLLSNQIERLDLKRGQKDNLSEFIEIRNEFRERFINEENWKDLLDDYFHKIGFFDHVQKNKYVDEAIENVNEFIRVFGEYKEQVKDAQISGFLEDAILSSVVDQADKEDKVNLMTVHGSKGLEFDTVFIINFAQGSFPMSNWTSGDVPLSDHSLHLEEERRLAYVAMTRAKEELHITYPRRNNFGFNESYNRKSTFIDEMDLPKIDYGTRDRLAQRRLNRFKKEE